MKKNQLGIGIVEILVVAAVIALVGALGWLVYQNQRADKSDKPAIKNQSSADMVANIKERVRQEIPAVKVTGAEEGNYNGYVSYRVAGYDFLSTVESKTLVNYEPVNPAQSGSPEQEAADNQKNEQTLKPVKEIILSTLSDNGFSRVADYPAEAIIGEGEGGMYERGSDVCAVNASHYSVGVSCATKEELAKVAKDVKPLVEVLRAAKVDEPEGTAYGLLETGTGTTASDRYARLSMGYAAAYFYQDGEKWAYFGRSSEGLGCTDIEGNPIAAKAFSKICRTPDESL